MVAHCLYRTVFVVGAVLARLVHLRQVHPLRGAVLAWLVSLLARLMSLLARLVHFLLWQAAKPSGDKCTP